MVWGALSLIALTVSFAYIAYEIGPGNRVEIDAASFRDVRFVLNWCKLGDDRIERVVHSYVSGRNITGDHFDAYAIQVSKLDVAELHADDEQEPNRWHRAEVLPPALDQAVEFALLFGEARDLQWLPPETEIRTSEFFVYPWMILLRETQVTAVQLIFARPSDKMVFYISAKT